MADQDADIDSLMGNAWLWEMTLLDDACISVMFLPELQKLLWLGSGVQGSTGKAV
jgi:hypothetical protein